MHTQQTISLIGEVSVSNLNLSSELTFGKSNTKATKIIILYPQNFIWLCNYKAQMHTQPSITGLCTN